MSAATASPLGRAYLWLLVTLGDALSSDVRLVLGVRFLGGFTTFSTFTVQVVIETDAGHAGTAAAYLLASSVAGLAAAVLGYIVGRVGRLTPTDSGGTCR